MASFNFMLSGSDEEILNAMRMADDIATEVNSNARSYTYDESSELIDSVFVTHSDFSEDSGCPKSQEFNKQENDGKSLFQMETEYQNLLQDVSALQVMCDLIIEENRRMKAENNQLNKSKVEETKQVLSVAMLHDNLAKIKTVTSHILAISEQFRQIKQVLGNAPSKNTLKISPSCQKHFIEFFHLANELIGRLEKDKDCIEACVRSDVDNWNPARRQLQLQISKALEEIERRMDSLTEFRSNLDVISTGETKFSNETITDCFNNDQNPSDSAEIKAVHESSSFLNS